MQSPCRSHSIISFYNFQSWELGYTFESPSVAFVSPFTTVVTITLTFVEHPQYSASLGFNTSLLSARQIPRIANNLCQLSFLSAPILPYSSQQNQNDATNPTYRKDHFLNLDHRLPNYGTKQYHLDRSSS